MEFTKEKTSAMGGRQVSRDAMENLVITWWNPAFKLSLGAPTNMLSLTSTDVSCTAAMAEPNPSPELAWSPYPPI